MGVQKITFEGGNVTSKIDADLYHHLFSGDVGILQNLKGECQFTLANNTITFSDGYISIYGRVIYVENLTTIGITPDSIKSGYVVLGINTSTNDVTIYLKEQAGGYPSLTITNLLTTDGLYEFVLCAYTKTTTSVTLNNSFERDYVSKDIVKVNDLRTEINDKYLPSTRGVTKVSNGVYQMSGTNSGELIQSIIYVVISNNTIVVFPGDLLFIGTGSNKTISYRVGSYDYSLDLAYADGVLTLTCGSAIHEITTIHLKK